MTQLQDQTELKRLVRLFILIYIVSYITRTNYGAIVSGVLNACTYIGSAISTYGIALVSEQFGWSASILIWLALSIGGLALCCISIPTWRKEME